MFGCGLRADRRRHKSFIHTHTITTQAPNTHTHRNAYEASEAAAAEHSPNSQFRCSATTTRNIIITSKQSVHQDVRIRRENENTKHTFDTLIHTHEQLNHYHPYDPRISTSINFRNHTRTSTQTHHCHRHRSINRMQSYHNLQTANCATVNSNYNANKQTNKQTKMHSLGPIY